MHHFQAFFDVVIERLFKKSLQRTDNERERCAKVMADISEESQLHVRHLYHLLLLYSCLLL